MVTIDDEDLGTVRMQNLPFRMSAGAGKVKHGGRRLGRDTDAVLREVLGMSDADLAALHKSGVTTAAS